MRSATTMKKVVWPRSTHLLAAATARWVLPLPLGPHSTNQPLGSSLNLAVASNAWRNMCRLTVSANGPSARVLAKLIWDNGPRLL